MDHLRDVPELHRALDKLANEHIYLPAPDGVDPESAHGRGDGRRFARRWVACDACDAVFVVRANVVSAICEDCAAPCPYHCGLLVHEHDDDGCAPGVAIKEAK